MLPARLSLAALVCAVLVGGSKGSAAEPITADEFRRELVGVPLCGTPDSGQFAGKMLCTVHLPDGTAVVAGQGLVVRGTWESDGARICRRNASDPLERPR